MKQKILQIIERSSNIKFSDFMNTGKLILFTSTTICANEYEIMTNSNKDIQIKLANFPITV